MRQIQAWLKEKDPSFGGLVRVQNNTISGFQENGNFTFNGTLTGSTASPGCSPRCWL